jgi:hypothetical protein
LVLVLATLPHLDRRSLLSSEACCAKEDGEGGWQHSSRRFVQLISWVAPFLLNVEMCKYPTANSQYPICPAIVEMCKYPTANSQYPICPAIIE